MCNKYNNICICNKYNKYKNIYINIINIIYSNNNI